MEKRKFKCTGCGEDRPCYLETNQGKGEIAFYDPIEDLKCVLDPTNCTSFNWKEVTENEDSSDIVLCPLCRINPPIDGFSICLSCMQQSVRGK